MLKFFQYSDSFKYIFFSLSLCFLAIFIGTLFSDVSNLKKHTMSIAFVLDVSESMNVQDIEGNSRLEAAKKYIIDTMQEFPAGEFSLTIFAGESLRVLPFMQDINLMQTFLMGIDASNISKQGTRIDLALEDAMENFIDEKQGTIVLLTDGDEENISLAFSVKDKILKNNIDVGVVGVGSELGGYIPTGDIFSPYKLYKGNPVIAKLNEAGLRGLANELNGKYIFLTQKLPLDIQRFTTPYSKSILLLLASFLFWTLFLGSLYFEIYKK